MPTTVTVAAAVGSLAESAGNTAAFVATRDNTSGGMAVNFTLSGTASNGSDYSASAVVFFAPGQATANVMIDPTDDSTSEATESIVFTLNSGSGYSVGSPSSASIDILDNDTPVAVDDEFEGDEDDEIEGDVLANDSDPNNNSMTVSLVDGPSFGTLNLNPDGTFEYTPDADFCGIDVFTYSVSDGGTGSSVGVVTITIDPDDADTPVIGNQEFEIKESLPAGSIVGVVDAHDPDIGQSLTYSIIAGNSAGVFAIAASTGVITIANAAGLDYETNSAFSLTVQVTDNSTGTLSSTGGIDITVGDASEDPPNPAVVIQALNSLYDTIQVVYNGGTIQSQGYSGLNPAVTNGLTAAALSLLTTMSGQSSLMLAAVNTPNTAVYSAAQSSYFTNLLNLDVKFLDINADATKVLKDAAEAIDTCEGDDFRVKGVGSVLQNLGDYLEQLYDMINVELDKLTQLATALNPLDPFVFLDNIYVQCFELNLTLASNRLEQFATQINNYNGSVPEAVGAPIESLNAIYDDVETSLGDLDPSVGATTIWFPLALADDLLGFGATMLGSVNNETTFNNAKTNYLFYWPDLLGALDLEDDDYGYVGPVLNAADEVLTLIGTGEDFNPLDEDPPEGGALDIEGWVIATEAGQNGPSGDKFRLVGIGHSLATLDASLVVLEDQLNALQAQLEELADALDTAGHSAWYGVDGLLGDVYGKLSDALADLAERREAIEGLFQTMINPRL